MAVTILTYTGYDIQTFVLEIQLLVCFLLLEIIMVIGQCTDISEREAVFYEYYLTVC